MLNSPKTKFYLIAFFIAFGIFFVDRYWLSPNNLYRQPPVLDTNYYLNLSTDYRNMAYPLFRAFESTINGECPTRPAVKRLDPDMIEPLEFIDGLRHPHKGIWIEHMLFTLCDGEQKTASFRFKANPEGTPPDAIILDQGIEE